MNLLQKMKQYLALRKQGFCPKTAMQCFKQPLTEGDYVALIVCVAAILIITVLVWKDEIDGNMAALNALHNKMAVEAKNERAQRKHLEMVTVSMLNGRVFIDGKLTAICRLKASGDCF